MKIKVVGAASGEVTGSAYLVETSKTKILVDAGLFQGGANTEEKNRLPEGADPKKLDALLLTHAHLDHTGRIPLLLKHGYQNTIYATSATLDLAEIVLKDSAKIQLQDAVRKNKHHPEKHIEPLYTPEDLTLFRPLGKTVNLHSPIEVAEDITARFYDAGHMLGSTSIELTITEKGIKKVIVFSGDLGPFEQPIICRFEQISYADLVFLESTYGNMNHRPYSETIEEFEKIVHKAIEQKGKVLIPSFAIGRTQQILYHLAILFFQKKISPFPVIVDSPMAIEAGKVFAAHPDLFDEEATNFKNQGVFPLDRTWFKFITSIEESKQLNELKGPCVILAGAGMCNGGRIQHHLKFNLSNPSTHVLIVGYQSYGSLGRKLVDGKKQVKIHGELVDVLASVHTLNGFSAHAGQNDLLKWFDSFKDCKPKVLLTHGEDLQRQALASLIEKNYHLTPHLPQLNESVEL